MRTLSGRLQVLLIRRRLCSGCFLLLFPIDRRLVFTLYDFHSFGLRQFEECDTIPFLQVKVVGLFANNVVSFSSNVVPEGRLFSINSVSKPRMLSVPAVYVLGPLHLKTARECNGLSPT